MNKDERTQLHTWERLPESGGLRPLCPLLPAAPFLLCAALVSAFSLSAAAFADGVSLRLAFRDIISASMRSSCKRTLQPVRPLRVARSTLRLHRRGVPATCAAGQGRHAASTYSPLSARGCVCPRGATGASPKRRARCGGVAGVPSRPFIWRGYRRLRGY